MFLTVILGLVPYIPVMLQVASFFISTFGASKENIARFQKMVEQNKDQGLITVETYQHLTDFHQQMLAAHEAKVSAKASLAKAQAAQKAEGN